MRKATERVLKRINKSVPKEWQDAVVSEQYIAPDVREGVIEALAEVPTTPEEEKEHKRLQNLFDAGYYDAKESKVDEEIAKKIEDYIEEKIKEAIASGEIPDPSEEELHTITKKAKRNEKRKQKSSLRSKQGA